MEKEQDHIRVVEGCKRGDRRAQEELYKMYYSAMMSLTMRYTGNNEDALEVLNTGFLKVFQNIGKYDSGIAGLYTWIRKVLVNTCLDHIKKQKRQEPTKELDHNIDVEVPPSVVSKMKAAELLALVRTLPPTTAAVFNLYVMEGYNHREIGELLGIADGTSKWHLSEARKLMKKLLQTEALSIHE